MDRKKCFIVDIDGTVADLTHRLHHIKKKPKDWDAFFKGCADDAPIPHMMSLVSHMSLTAYIVFVSGRPERCRKDTEQWLYRHGYTYGFSPQILYMRPDGDRRDDNIVKGELLDKLLADGWEPIMAFDDRDRVVKMWRERGIPCAQVAPGDF
jgi:hypothetical protein